MVARAVGDLAAATEIAHVTAGITTMSITTTNSQAPLEYTFDDHSSDLDFFIAHQDELVEEYNGKILIICNQHVEGACDTVLEACAEGDRRFGKGNFSIQKCIAGPKAYTMRSRNLGLRNACSAQRLTPRI
jgi:hypothetical protein